MRTGAIGSAAAWVAVALVGCTVDRAGLLAPTGSQDGSAAEDGGFVEQDAGAGEPDGAPPDSGRAADAQPSDSGGMPADGGVVTCPAACPWGCEAGESACRRIPNVPPADTVVDWMSRVAGTFVIDARGTRFDLDGSDEGRIHRYDWDAERRTTYRDGGVGLDTDTGTRFVVLSQADGVPEIGVLVVESLHVTSGASLEARGSRSLLIVASEDIIIEGRIDVSADGAEPGPGGYEPDDGPGEGMSGGSSSRAGGGGAGFGARGGAGGSDLTVAGGSGGMAYDDGSLEPLRGGSGGGHGHGDDNNIAGGGGGGAVQLVAGRQLRVAEMAAVLAGGGGGECRSASGGGGGGAGGAIFLAAPEVQVDGLLAANGGGGGSGDGYDEDRWQCRGSDGEASSDLAPGGTAGGNSAAGGAGGAADELEGLMGEESADGGGGGGGAVGRIRILTWQGPLSGGGTISPSLHTQAVRVDEP